MKRYAGDCEVENGYVDGDDGAAEWWCAVAVSLVGGI